MKRPNVIVFEADYPLYNNVQAALNGAGFNTSLAPHQAAMFSLIKSAPPDVVVLGPSATDPEHTLELAVHIRQVVATVQLVLLVSHSSEELAIAALRAGINEYVKFPFREEDLVDCARRCLARSSDRVVGSALQGGDRFVGDSAVMRDVRVRLARVARTDSNVLVTGETGTGKELAAELLHRNSVRSKRPFVTINCAAIPDSLFESELFGYDRGAFTGAEHSRAGKLDAAEGGTVFLDEIGDMSLYGQAKMLRMIECHEVQRLGRNLANPVNIRVVAATNRELEPLTRDGSFRKDLFFRLAVTCIRLPALRERKEDLLPLLTYYIRYFNRRFDRSVKALSEDAIELMMSYDWPGNVRELRNMVEAIFVDLPSAETEIAELPLQFRSRCGGAQHVSGDERARLICALSATNWNKSKAASRLQWSRMTLYRKMARYDIH